MNSWYVAYTHASSENKASDHLRRQGFEVYLPRTRRWRRHARRREAVLGPLFPRYLFVGFDITQVRWRSIFSTVGVSTLLCNGDVPITVPSNVVEQIRFAEDAGVFDESSTLGGMRPGDQVRVMQGPFTDVIARLQSLVSSQRVRILIELLGRQVPTVVDVHEIEPA